MLSASGKRASSAAAAGNVAPRGSPATRSGLVQEGLAAGIGRVDRQKLDLRVHHFIADAHGTKRFSAVYLENTSETKTRGPEKSPPGLVFFMAAAPSPQSATRRSRAERFRV